MTDKKEALENEVVTGDCRIAFPQLFEAKPNYAKTRDVFSAVVLIPPGTDLTPFQNAIKSAASDFGRLKKGEKIKIPLKSCADKEHLDGYDEGWHYVNVSSGYMPAVVDNARVPVLKSMDDAGIRAAQDVIYGGCFCRFHLSCYSWEHPEGGKGISFTVHAVQKVGEGERFGSKRRDVMDVFEPVAIDADDDASAFGESDDASDLFS